MKGLVALVLVAAALPARADMEMERPPPAIRMCGSRPTFAKIEQCLEQHSAKLALERELPHARLFRVSDHTDGGSSGEYGLALYVERAGRWILGGSYEVRGTYEVLAAEPVTVGKHDGYRVEVGEVMRVPVSPDGTSIQDGTVVLRRVLLCSGDSWQCNEFVTSCDVLVRGAAFWSFRGTLSIADNQVRITGDRSHTGSLCAFPDTQLLGWTQ